MSYIKGICKVMLEESFLSVFAMKFLENKLLSMASILNQRDLVLEVMGVLFALRVAMQDRMESIEEEIHEHEGLVATQLSVTLEFENSYPRGTIEEYIGQFAAYCGLSHNDITIGHIRTGSTVADLNIAAATAIPDILRFFKYSLSFATATVLQAGKLKNAYHKLTAPDARANQMIRSATSKPVRKKSSKSRRTQKKAIRSNVDISLPFNAFAESVGPTEIFVDRTRERVLIVDGKLRVTITVL